MKAGPSRPRRMTVAVVLSAVTSALVVTGCSGDSDSGASKGADSPLSQPAAASSAPAGTAAGKPVDPNAKLAEMKGAGGVVLVVNQVLRDSGGFVTVQGVLTNTGPNALNPAAWSGTETVIQNRNLNSVGGATLVDKAGKKRYYILRDTDGQCLCTNKLTALTPGESIPVFMQFPAPPAGTTEVDLTLPNFATASLRISG
jgi:hypothetical protein